MVNRSLVFAVVLTGLTSLVGCGGGGGGGGGLASAAQTQASGQVVANTVFGATVRLHTILPGGELELLAESNTDGTGQFLMEFQGDGPFLLVAGGGSYFDEATGEERSLGALALGNLSELPPMVLAAVVGDDEWLGNVTLTPLTTIVVERLWRMAGGDPSELDGATVRQVHEEIAAELGIGSEVDPVDVRRVDPFDLSSFSEGAEAKERPDAPASQLGLLLAALSQAGIDARFVDPLELADLLADDAADGVFDGMDEGVPLEIDGVPLSEDVLAWIAGAAKEFLEGEANRSGAAWEEFEEVLEKIEKKDLHELWMEPLEDLKVALGEVALELGFEAPAGVDIQIHVDGEGIVGEIFIEGVGGERVLHFQALEPGLVEVFVKAIVGDLVIERSFLLKVEDDGSIEWEEETEHEEEHEHEEEPDHEEEPGTVE